MEISLEFPGRLPVELIRWEIICLTRLCESQATEKVFCDLYVLCGDCVATAARLGKAEVARRVTQR